MLVAALELGAKNARLVNYATSGDVTGDNRQVVAYASVIIN
jgi:AmmeMemoRadiSam system protein B